MSGWSYNKWSDAGWDEISQKYEQLKSGSDSFLVKIHDTNYIVGKGSMIACNALTKSKSFKVIQKEPKKQFQDLGIEEINGGTFKLKVEPKVNYSQRSVSMMNVPDHPNILRLLNISSIDYKHLIVSVYPYVPICLLFNERLLPPGAFTYLMMPQQKLCAELVAGVMHLHKHKIGK